MLMKKRIISIFFFNFLLLFFAEENTQYQRLYFFKIISFHTKFEVYCTKEPLGYYKYSQNVNEDTVYLTYEGNKFYEQCKFDENLTVFEPLYPLNIWTNRAGKLIRLKKRFGPVIEKNRKKKNYPYGYGQN